MLQYKQEHHLSCTQTAMHFCLDVVTVCRWEKKFQKEGARGLMLWLKPFRKETPPWHALFPAWIEYGIPPEPTMLATAPTLGNDAELLQEIIAAAKESGIAEPLSFQDMLYLEDPSYYHYAVIRETAENGKGYDIRLFAFTNEDVSKVYLAWISATAYIGTEEIIFPATATPAEVTQCMNDYLSGS